MKNFLLFIPKKTLTLIVILLFAIIFLVVFVNLQPTPIQPQPTISPFQKSISGKTTSTDIENRYKIKNKEILPNGDLKYSIETNIIDRPDQIIVHNNTAKFERIVIDSNKYALGDMQLSEKILDLGPAEKVVKGSEFYGKQIETYIYPSQGLAFVANTYTDEIYEIQVFTPTTLEQYLSLYGQDIKEYESTEETPPIQ